MGIYLFNHRQRGKIMALRSKNEEPQIVEQVEEKTNQVSLDDLEYEVTTVDFDEEESEKTVYYTISGKEQEYEPSWERYTVSDLSIGDEFEGRPEVTIFEKPDKSYNALKLRLMDDGEILDLYFNYPKKNWPNVRKLQDARKSEKEIFDFYINCYDVVFSVLKWVDPNNVIGPDGEEINTIETINLETLAKIIDGMERVGVKIIEGSPYNDYSSWMIYKME